MQEVVVTDCDGNQLDMASSLATFIANRVTRKFDFGDWLKSLNENHLRRIQKLDEESERGSSSAYAHLIQIAIIALSAELMTREVTIQLDTVKYIPCLATLESLQRKGLLTINSPIKLAEAAQLKFTLSDEGIHAGLEMYKGLTIH